MMIFLHALVIGLVLVGANLTLDRMGLYEGKTKMQKFWVSAPVYFVLALLLNLVWPWPG